MKGWGMRVAWTVRWPRQHRIELKSKDLWNDDTSHRPLFPGRCIGAVQGTVPVCCVLCLCGGKVGGGFKLISVNHINDIVLMHSF